MFRQRLSKLKWFLFRQKFRFDMGFQFLSLVNFTLLIITATSTLRLHMELPRTWVIVAVMVPLAFFGVWLFGWFLDRFVRYWQAYNIESQRRNPAGEESMALLYRIDQKLDRLLNGGNSAANEDNGSHALP